MTMQYDTSTTNVNAGMVFFLGSFIWSPAVKVGDEWCSRYKGHTLAQLQNEFPDMELITFEAAIDRENEAYRQPWKEITEERYIDQLEVLPPMDWNRSTGGESFKSMERYGGDVTSIFARRDGRFFECRDLDSLPHAEIMKQIDEGYFAGKAANSGH